ncbi:hypothetical protein F5Y18DRAFT_430195 [Xylariaceae sp. FL1019]|nr:hypothetical protein F5Y18DRAFT_430195 [Xylariaceae sp. FL1019]
MAGIKDLPVEVIVMVFSTFDDIETLLVALLVCRQFFDAYNTWPSVALKILQQQIGSALLPYAIAISKISRMDTTSLTIVEDLLDSLFKAPDSLTLERHEFSMPDCLGMSNLHSLIHSFAHSFASDAWHTLYPRPSDQFVLSSTEERHFCRAFYRVEVILAVCKYSNFMADRAWFRKFVDAFCDSHSPWIREQLACVSSYHHKRFFEATRDFLANNTEVNEMYSRGVAFRPPTSLEYREQALISKGVMFIHKLESAASRENQRTALLSVLAVSRRRHCSLYDFMWMSCRKDDGREPRLIELHGFTKEQLNTLGSPREYGETDEGPYIAWRSTREYCSWPSFVSRYTNAPLLPTAYVLWDSTRIDRYNMLDTIRDFKGEPGRAIRQRRARWLLA